MKRGEAIGLLEGPLTGSKIAATHRVVLLHHSAPQTFKTSRHCPICPWSKIDLSISIDTESTELVRNITTEVASKHDVVEVSTLSIRGCGSLLDMCSDKKLLGKQLTAEIALRFVTPIKDSVSKHWLLDSVPGHPQSVSLTINKSVLATRSIPLRRNFNGENLVELGG